MYLRFTQRSNADGSVVRYVSIAHNQRIDGKVRPNVLVNLGRVDRHTIDRLRGLAASINRHFGLHQHPDRLDTVTRQLGITSTVKQAVGDERFSPHLERALSGLLTMRGAEAADHSQIFVAMDLLIEADTADGGVQRSAFLAAARLLNLQIDLLFLLTSSTYFQPASDRRDELPPITIGLVVTKDGLPVRVWCWPGHIDHEAVIANVEGDLHYLDRWRLITVVDRRHATTDELADLVSAPGRYVAELSLRQATTLARTGTSHQHDRDTAHGLRIEETRLDNTNDVHTADIRIVIIHDSEQAEHDRTDREQTLTLLETELNRIRRQRETSLHDNGKTTTKKTTEAARTKTEHTLRTHPTLSRWLRQDDDGHLSIDHTAIEQDASTDGTHAIAIYAHDITSEDTALGYKHLLNIRRQFAGIRSELLRSVFHQLEHRIHGHILTCCLTALLHRVTELTKIPR